MSQGRICASIIQGCVTAQLTLSTLTLIHPCPQVGMSLRPRHPDALIYTAVRAPDSRCFDLFHALLRGRAFEFIDTARAMGEWATWASAYMATITTAVGGQLHVTLWSQPCMHMMSPTAAN